LLDPNVDFRLDEDDATDNDVDDGPMVDPRFTAFRFIGDPKEREDDNDEDDKGVMGDVVSGKSGCCCSCCCSILK